MIDPDRFLLFLLSSIVLLASPGPAILYVVTQSVARGARAGAFAALGLTAGVGVHVIAAALGLSALFATSHLAFEVVRLAGAAYLILLGVRQILTARAWRVGEDEGPTPSPVRVPVDDALVESWRQFRQGLVINVLNPKVALFFLAFFPQFLNPESTGNAVHILSLGLVFAALTLSVDMGYALVSGLAGNAARRRLLDRSPGRRRVAGYVPGLIYVGLGLAAAFAPIERR